MEQFRIAHRVVFEGADSARKVAVKAFKVGCGVELGLAPRKPLACDSTLARLVIGGIKARGCRVLFGFLRGGLEKTHS
jgi:hypothetical protein